jgi:uncharacterized RDD family membrane protein YckC
LPWRAAILTCEKCAAEVPEGASVCPQCETPLSVAQIGPVYVPQSAPATQVIPAIHDLSALPARPAFAGFWLRAVACFIDTILIAAIFVLGASFFPSTFEKLLPTTPPSLTAMPQPAPLVIVLLVSLGCLYYTVFEASSWQATPGKRILKLYVTDLNGQRISIQRALIRNLARQISGIFFIGYVIAGFTEKKQALHDIIASCLVFRRP